MAVITGTVIYFQIFYKVFFVFSRRYIGLSLGGMGEVVYGT